MVNFGLARLARPLILLGNSDQAAESRERSAGDDPPLRLQPAARHWRGRYRRPEQPLKEPRSRERPPRGEKAVVAGKAHARRPIAGRMGIARLRMRDNVFQILASGGF